MMKDIEIKISRETRMVDLSKTTIGNDGENLQGNLVFSFTDDFVKGQGRLEYVINGESKYAFLLSNDENYYIPIKSVMTKEGQIDMQLVITEGTDVNEIPIFKSNVFYVSCKKSINAEVKEEKEYYSWIEIANTKLNEIDEVVEDIETKLANGEFNGKDGVDGKDGKDFTYEDFTEEQLENLRGPQGVPGEPGADGKDYVLTEADKEEIADNINEENNDRITETEKDISELENTIEILTNTDTKKGELVHITDALPLATFENKVDGNVEQETTTGKNKANIDKNYTFTGLVNITDLLDLTPNTDYIVSCKSVVKGGSEFPYIRIGDRFLSLTGENEWSFTIGDTKGNCYIYSNGTSASNSTNITSTVNELMIRLASDTDNTYEPYTGGQASPNPEYPQEIEVLEGYNEFDISKVLSNSPTLINNGDTLTIATPNNNASVRPTAPYTLKDFCPNLKVGETYYLNANTTGTFKYIYLDIPANSWFFGTTRTITQDDLDSPVRFYASGLGTTATISNIIISKENRPYVPYGCVGYKVIGKNRLPNIKDITKEVFGATASVINNEILVVGTATNSGGRLNALLKFNLPAGSYKFGLTNSVQSDVALSNTSTSTVITITKGNYVKFTLSEETQITLGVNVIKNTTHNDKFKAMIVDSDITDYTYEPYQEQIVPLDLKGNFVGAINDNIKDYLVTDKKRLWLVKNVGKVVLNGSENWELNSNSGDSYRYWLKDTSLANNFSNIFTNIVNRGENDLLGNIFCTHFTQTLFSGTAIGKFSINVVDANYNRWFLLNVTETSVDNLKTWLSNNNVEVYYRLAKPQIIELGELPEPIKTFEGVNNIQLLANLDTEIEVKYALDLKKYYDNKLAEISAQII